MRSDFEEVFLTGGDLCQLHIRFLSLLPVHVVIGVARFSPPDLVRLTARIARLPLENN